MDFIQNLDPNKLLVAETALSFFLSIFDSPSYNFPLFLFGIYANENAESSQPLQTFTGLLGASALFDIIWMFRNSQTILLRLLTVTLLLLKIPTFLALGSALRQRGSHFGGLGIRGNDLSGPTIWSMPGGFTSEGRTGYQPLDEEQRNRPPPSRPVASVTQPTAQPPAVPGAYQTV